jgi:hypothetical protein
VKVEHGGVAVVDVGGSATLQTSYEAIRLDRVAGTAGLVVHHGGVEASGLERGARVQASSGDVSLDGFGGPVDLDLDRGNARLSPRAIVTAPVSVSVKHGEAELELPQGSAVLLQCESRRGEIHADEVPGLAAEHPGEGPTRELSGRVAGGGPLVILRADGDVTVTTGPAEAVSERAIAKPEITAQDAPPEFVPAAPAEAPLTGPAAR